MSHRQRNIDQMTKWYDPKYKTQRVLTEPIRQKKITLAITPLVVVSCLPLSSSMPVYTFRYKQGESAAVVYAEKTIQKTYGIKNKNRELG